MKSTGGFFLSIPVQTAAEDAARQLTACNRATEPYGLTLTEKEAAELVDTRNRALADLGRIEFGGGVLTKLVLLFRNSPYLYRQNYSQTLGELIEIFYYFKNEFLDRISDDELLLCMKECFDNRCGGSVELMEGRELECLARRIRYGLDYRFRNECGTEERDRRDENGEDDDD